VKCEDDAICVKNFVMIEVGGTGQERPDGMVTGMIGKVVERGSSRVSEQMGRKLRGHPANTGLFWLTHVMFF